MELRTFLIAAYEGDVATLSSGLATDPTLAHAASRGTDPDYFEAELTALHLAPFGGDVTATRLLLDAGASVDAAGRHATPLFQAAYAQSVEAVTLLLQAGADADHRHVTGETALHVAAFRGGADIVRLLIEAGADVNAVTGRGPTDMIMGCPPVVGETPLHLAAAYGHVEAIEALLAAGADRAAEDRAGQTPADWAARHLQKAAHEALLPA